MLILALLLFGILVGGIAQLLLGTPMKEINWASPSSPACWARSSAAY